MSQYSAQGYAQNCDESPTPGCYISARRLRFHQFVSAFRAVRTCAPLLPWQFHRISSLCTFVSLYPVLQFFTLNILLFHWGLFSSFCWIMTSGCGLLELTLNRCYLMLPYSASSQGCCCVPEAEFFILSGVYFLQLIVFYASEFYNFPWAVDVLRSYILWATIFLPELILTHAFMRLVV